jgi:hypothetical protein
LFFKQERQSRLKSNAVKVFDNGLAKASINLWYSFEIHLLTGTPEKKERSNGAEISTKSFI